jgi:hypothetical protein
MEALPPVWPVTTHAPPASPPPTALPATLPPSEDSPVLLSIVFVQTATTTLEWRLALVVTKHVIAAREQPPPTARHVIQPPSEYFLVLLVSAWEATIRPAQPYNFVQLVTSGV